MTVKPQIKWMDTSDLLAMVNEGARTNEIADAQNCSCYSVRQKLYALGCKPNTKARGCWIAPKDKPAAITNGPALANLARQFPFIKTMRKASAFGPAITLPCITMRVVEGGKFGSVA
jgi:hypothetical protein